ncbi:endo-1,3-beta-glucanase Engl1 [Penicillium brasilianum]|uniref:Glucan endo-1,3-beta-D-glucosidase 1 n=1 Tax=Penicillium brasilianum TaxID=104259 RepID=A0A1S9RRW0_PENBI|nr:endo-1,3-beta-glucanase Engl1 [Penicillium brasilianum]
MAALWKTTAVLTWLLATDSVNCLPQPAGTVAEYSLEQSATHPETAFKTQYPPSNQRIAIPETEPDYRVALDKRGHPSQLPFPTVDVGRILEDIGGLLSPQSTTSLPDALQPTDSPTDVSPDTITSATDLIPIPSAAPMNNQNIFEPVATGAVPANIETRHDHPVQNEHADATNPIETNKFYAGLFLGSQTNATFTQPYSLAWSRGGGTLKSWGVSASHVEENLLAYGPPNPNLPGSPVNYYINPIGIQHIILSASELDESSVLSTEEPKAFSAQAVLKRSGGSAQSITFPVVQGMGYVTGVYSDLQPLVESGVFFRKVVNAGSPKPGIFKYQLFLEDDTVWLLYAAPDDGKDPQLELVSTSSLRGPAGFTGTIQVAKNPADKAGEKFYDNSAGVYPIAGAVSGAVTGTVGTYGLSWTKAGKNATDTPLIMFALPHHVESFDASTSGRATNIHLRTTTKGNATAVIGDNWVMTEPDLPMDMGFAPWSPTKGSVHTLSASAQQSIIQIAPVELQQDINGQTNLNSMYYSGKALSKFATLIWTVSNLGNGTNSDVASAALVELKKSFARFVQNQQQYPLAYDSVWKGVVSTAGYDGDLNADFGNTAYNDHHFHYGYFIQAAAIIGSLDPTWLAQNKDWVNMLVRDAGNSVEDDPYFPFSRSFDWFNGHSWAKGLFESFDGKDQESTSEDTMFAYAVKMWGQTTGDASMEARGNMMLAILRRSLNNYFLMQSNNTNQPSNFIANKVTGILFENKVDHTTYFGNNLEYIQGIHMLPLLPNSGYTRQQQFVAEEWQAIFAANASTPATGVDGGWKGVLFANLALVDPQASWDFFAQQEFDYSWIDGGASRTWYLAYAAGLGGGP